MKSPRRIFRKFMSWLGFIHKSHISGNALIIPEGKFEVARMQDEFVITPMEIYRTRIPLERFEQMHRQDMSIRLAKKILEEIAEWEHKVEDSPDGTQWHRYTMSVWLAIRKK